MFEIFKFFDFLFFLKDGGRARSPHSFEKDKKVKELKKLKYSKFLLDFTYFLWMSQLPCSIINGLLPLLFFRLSFLVFFRLGTTSEGGGGWRRREKGEGRRRSKGREDEGGGQRGGRTRKQEEARGEAEEQEKQ